MHVTYHERLERNPHLRDIRSWPDIPLGQVDKTKRSTFQKNKRSVAMALKGMAYADIQKKTGVCPSVITKLLVRALAGDVDQEPLLTQALIPWQRLNSSHRQSPLPSLDNPGGARSSFQHLLATVKGLEKKLDRILRHYVKDDPESENIRPAAFHGYFMQFLEEAGHPKDLYPYTQDDLAYESVRLYMHKRLDELRMERIIKHQPKRVITPRQSPFAYGRELQIDEQTYDAQSTVYLSFNDELVPLRMARFCLILLSDVDTDCRIGFHLGFTQHASQYDILEALETCFIPEPLPELTTPGLSYCAETGFPRNLGDFYTRIGFNALNIDNALTHHAANVKSYWHHRHYGVFNAGIPISPQTRNLIEHAIKLLSMQAKRLNATSGKHPADPQKESRKNQKKVPVITVQEIEEMIRVLLVKHNNTPQPRLNGATPLQTCQYHASHQLLRLIPQDALVCYQPYEVRKRVTVRWLKHEERAPHVNFCYCRYQGKALNDEKLAGQHVEIRYDYRDIRKLSVYTLTGEYLGEVFAPKTWQRYPHSEKTRSYIHRITRKARIRMKDPLVEFFWIQMNRKNQQKAVLEITRLYREYHAFGSDDDPNNTDPDPNTSAMDVSDNTEDQFTLPSAKQPTVPSWSTEIANAK